MSEVLLRNLKEAQTSAELWRGRAMVYVNEIRKLQKGLNRWHKRANGLACKLTASQRKTDEQASALRKANDKVDDLYNLFFYAEQDEDVLNMTGGKPLIGWLREREEEWYRKGNR